MLLFICRNSAIFLKSFCQILGNNFGTVAVNVVYLMVAMVVLNFLEANTFLKYYLVILVFLNTAASSFNEGISLFVITNLFVTSWAGKNDLHSQLKSVIHCDSLSVYAFTKWFMRFLSFLHSKFGPDSFTFGLTRSQNPEKSPEREESSEDSDSESCDGENSEINDLTKEKSPVRKVVDLNATFYKAKPTSTPNVTPRITSIKPTISPLSISQVSPIVTERPVTPYERPLYERPLTPDMRRVMSESFEDRRVSAGTPFMTGMAGRIQCSGITQKGLQCRNAAIVGGDKCRLHK